jgi:dipeptidyl-peptidase-4
VIQDNAALAVRLKGFDLPTKEFFVLKTEKGNERMLG